MFMATTIFFHRGNYYFFIGATTMSMGNYYFFHTGNYYVYGQLLFFSYR